MGAIAPTPPAAISRVLATFNREQLEGFVAVAIDLMDMADGDPDEGDPFNEDEPAFDAASRATVNGKVEGPGDPISGDGEPGAWREWHNMSAHGRSGSNCTYGLEDAEEDDSQGEVTDDDPAFTKRDRKIANRTARGPGCSISDPDYCPTELGEQDEGENNNPRVYGVDQTRAVGPDNPPFSSPTSNTCEEEEQQP